MEPPPSPALSDHGSYASSISRFRQDTLHPPAMHQFDVILMYTHWLAGRIVTPKVADFHGAPQCHARG